MAKQHQKSGLSILPVDLSFLARKGEAAVGVTGGNSKDCVIQKVRLHGHRGHLLHKSVGNLKVNSHVLSSVSYCAPSSREATSSGTVLLGRTFPT